MKYPFMTIILGRHRRKVVVPGGNPSMGKIDLLENYPYSIKMLHIDPSQAVKIGNAPG